MLSVRHLNFAYQKGKLTLDDLSFGLEKGKVTVLLGKNGSGKSTLIKCLIGIIKRKENQIFLGEDDLCKLNRETISQKMSYVPQDITFGHLTVLETLLTGLTPFHHSRKEELLLAENAAKELEIAPFLEKNVDELSGGERQKVAIARALAGQPEIMIFDEPTGNLDMANELLVLNLARKLAHEKGITVLIAIHNLNLALEYGDNYLLLKEGKLLDDGDIATLTAKKIKDAFDIYVHVDKVRNKRILMIGDEYDS